MPDLKIAIFESPLGWIGLAGQGSTLHRLVFGQSSLQLCSQALSDQLPVHASIVGDWETPLVDRLQAYLDGSPESFADVDLDQAGYSAFTRRVIAACRRIPHGTTRTYAQLAAEVGSPRAARAVGGVMAANRHPLVVPCHRVVGSGGGLGGFSAAGGLKTKRELLQLECAVSVAGAF